MILFTFIILIKSVDNKNKNYYYYNIFLEKGLHEEKSDTYYKRFISIELTFLKELMLIKQIVYQILSVTIDIS